MSSPWGFIHHPSETNNNHNLAKTLGWFSVGLGVAELAAPQRVAQFIGVNGSPTVMRLTGLREI